MTVSTMEEKIRERAYELWQKDGSLEGCADEYWHLAREQIEKETAAKHAAGTGDVQDPAQD